MQIISKLRREIYLVLRASEKYTKTDMVYLAKGGFWTTISQLISLILNFIVAVAFANFISKDVYGNYQYILSIASILAVFSLNEMGTAFVRAVAQGYEGILRKSIMLKLKWSFLITIVSFLIGIYYFINKNNTIGFSMLIIGIILPINYIFKFYMPFLNGRKLFKQITFCNIITNLFYFITILITLFITNNIILLILAYFLSNTIVNILLYYYTIKKYKPNNNMDSNSIKYGIKLSLINVLGIIYSYIDKILIFHYFGAIDFAIYSFAVNIPNQARYILRGLEPIILPRFSKRSINDIKIYLNKKIFMSFILILMIIIIYILIAPFIYKLFFPEYINSIFYSQVYSLSLIGFIPVINTTILQSQAALKQIYIYSIMMPIISLSFVFLFINLYGIMGVIIATIINKFIGIVFSYVLIRKMT